MGQARFLRGRGDWMDDFLSEPKDRKPKAIDAREGGSGAFPDLARAKLHQKAGILIALRVKRRVEIRSRSAM